MKKALIATGIFVSTILGPVFAIVLLVSFVRSLLRAPMWPWWFWTAGIAVILLLHIGSKTLIRFAEGLEDTHAGSPAESHSGRPKS